MALGTQKGKLVPCAHKPKTHGFHPERERCQYCPEELVPWRVRVNELAKLWVKP